jgi:8-oxo-dGTP diphosphatase/2-hydroxy-dATP diphosphatase
MKKQYTLALVFKNNQILLGMKKTGFGAGRWNGFGGKVEPGEAIIGAAKRELKEECGLDALEIREIGTLDFSFESEPKLMEVHIFKITKYSGEPVETDEMRPEWFDLDKIPFEQMWSDDEHWFPYMLKDIKFTGSFHFDQPSTATYSAKIIKKEIRIT